MFKGGMGNMMKQAQQMQERMQQAQEEIANMEVTGEAGAGLVSNCWATIMLSGSQLIQA